MKTCHVVTSLFLTWRINSAPMWLFFEEQRVELNPCHIGLSHIGDVAAGAFGHRRFRGRRRIRLRMMPEGKVTPAVTIGKALVVLYRDVNAVEHPVEIASPGWLGTGTVGECRIKNSRQFLHEDCAFRKRARLQISIEIARLHIYVVVFRESSVPVIEGIWRQGGADENPPAITSRQLQFTVGSEDGAGLLHLRGGRLAADHSGRRSNQGDHSQCYSYIFTHSLFSSYNGFI